MPNVAEGRDSDIISALCEAASGAAHVLDSSADIDHNRAVISLAGEMVEDGAFALVAVAVERLDLRRHSGVHPRRGVADVVPLIPIGDAPIEGAIAAARRLGERIWRELGIPVYFYGAGGHHTLAQIRSTSPPPPDLGAGAHPSAGVVCVGARGPLIAYNALLHGVDLATAGRIAKALRESSGGVRGIQALAFAVTGGVQLSMNLTRPTECPPSLALDSLRELAGPAHVGQDEVVGLCPAVPGQGCDAADGKLFEARLAAAAARAAARLCRSRAGSEEMQRLAERLEAEAGSLARLGWAQALEGSERAAALIRVLQAGRVGAPQLHAMLSSAAEGFRKAVGRDTAARHPERVAALDRWLANPPAGA